MRENYLKPEVLKLLEGGMTPKEIARMGVSSVRWARKIQEKYSLSADERRRIQQYKAYMAYKAGCSIEEYRKMLGVCVSRASILTHQFREIEVGHAKRLPKADWKRKIIYLYEKGWTPQQIRRHPDFHNKPGNEINRIIKNWAK